MAYFVLFLFGHEIVSATPGDWCARPEAPDYTTNHRNEPMVLPGSGVKSVFYPNGKDGSKAPITFVFSKSGLIDKTSSYWGEYGDCVTYFQRDENGRLEKKVHKACSKRIGDASKEESYSYFSNGWIEDGQNYLGEIHKSTVTEYDGVAAKWTIHKERTQGSSGPGYFETITYNEKCIEVGDLVFPDERIVLGKGSIYGPIITRKIELVRDKNGYDQITSGKPFSNVYRRLSVNGLLVKEIFYTIQRPSEVMAINEVVYKIDNRGNWVERKEIFTQVERGEQVSESVETRVIEYYQ